MREPKELGPYLPPATIPVNGWNSMSAIEHCVIAWADVYACMRPFKVHRIDLSEGVMLYSTRNGSACTLLLRTDAWPEQMPEIIEGWPTVF